MVYYCVPCGFEHDFVFINSYFMRRNRGSYPFLIFILSLVFIGIIFAFAKDGYRRYQIDKEITEFKRQMASLEKENKILTELLDYFSSDKSLEKEARIKLGLAKEGEKLVIISPEKKTASGGQELRDNIEKRFSNFDKWLEYLFK